MRLIWDILLFVLVAVGLGLGSAYLAINHADKLELTELGPWKAWPNAAGPKADPYSRANQARSGALLIGTGEGITFQATSDDVGTPLDGACQYRISGGHLPARLWTLTLVDEKGMVVDNPSNRYGYDNQSLLRYSGSRFDIVIGPTVMGNNWLQSPSNGTFRLILRLYDTPLTSGGSYSEISLPRIEWESCK